MYRMISCYQAYKEDNIQKKRAQEAELAKHVIKNQQIAQLPHATTLVVTPGTQDGLSNLVHATGIQIISESDAARLQPVRNHHESDKISMSKLSL